MKTGMKKLFNRIIAFMVLIIFLSINLPIYAVTTKSSVVTGTVWDKAMHFIIRHWHAVPDPDAYVEAEDGDHSYFVIVEGYIVPNGDEYDFYFVDRQTGERIEVSSADILKTPYVDAINKRTGTVRMPVNIISDSDGNPLEKFSGFSVSAGHEAVNSGSSGDNIVISYKPDVHVVKTHIFYSNKSMLVYGSGPDDAVFGTAEGQTDPEQDTTYLYTYINDIVKDDVTYYAGDIVRGTDGNPIADATSLPEDLKVGIDVRRTKLYSTIEGLHTDKTVTALGDGRTFNIDLESWYSGAPMANVGLVLDASGSMAFASNGLKPINVNELPIEEEKKQQLLDKRLQAENYPETQPTESDWLNTIFLTPEEVSLILNPYNMDNSRLSSSDYSYFVYDKRSSVQEYVALSYWDGTIKDTNDSIIGYYPFEKGPAINNSDRDWLKNVVSKDGAEATLVNQIQIKDLQADTQSDEPESEEVNSDLEMESSNTSNIQPTNVETVESVNSTQTVEETIDNNSKTEQSNNSEKVEEKESTNENTTTKTKNEQTISGNLTTSIFQIDEVNSNENKTSNELENNTITNSVVQTEETNTLNTNEVNNENSEITNQEENNMQETNGVINEQNANVLENNDLIMNETRLYSLLANEDIFIRFTDALLPDDWTQDKRLSFTTDKGLNILDPKVEEGENGVGILLDAHPTSIDNFTVSFKITKDTKTADQKNAQNYVDILYIGEKENTETSKCYRLVRDGRQEGAVSPGSSNNDKRLRGYNSDAFHNKVTDITDVLNNTNSHTVTLVFRNGNLTSYLDGEVANSGNTTTNNETPVELTGDNIILYGFDNDYNGATLFVDDVIVFDKALDPTEITSINNIINGEKLKNYIIYNQTNIDEPIGFIDGDYIGLSGGIPGWYYVNYDADPEYYFNPNLQSEKHYFGILENTENYIYTDKAPINTGIEETPADTGFTYDPSTTTSVQFYIDANGYLRCFYAGGTYSKKEDKHGVSYVYEKDDMDYVKVELLQRAIGNFVTLLDEVSPSSQISAVRFSTPEFTDEVLDKLVLLDWTNNPSEAQGMMSLNRGTGGTIEGTMSTPAVQNREKGGIMQYNYGLTGGTATYTGLKAFYNNLYGRTEPSASKYLIIFTDGKDSCEETERLQAVDIANTLKADGYTIMAVLLAGGSVKYDESPESEYGQAKEFLMRLVGTDDTEEDKSEFFFSTSETSEGLDSLTQIFSENVISKITYNLLNYTVKDYIDPRFDLISAENKIYNLRQNGSVIIKNQEGLALETKDISTEPITVTLSEDYSVDDTARKAKLNYDKTNNMYYLTWEKQTIPGCTINAEKLPVWNARVTVRAKDDFIGGNTVLTNGNSEKMNLVYSEKDLTYSSGPNDYKLTDENKYPSKGFPRVAVNVSRDEGEFNDSQIIYMGETINKEKLSGDLFDKTYDSFLGSYKYHYMEYLERYGKIDGKSLEDYKKEIYENGKITVPYYYISDKDETAQTGTEKHENELFGYIEYSLASIVEKDAPDDGLIEDKLPRKLVVKATYKPLQDNEGDTNRISEIQKLVDDDYYKYSQTYKQSVDATIENEELVTGNFELNEVSGQIALKLVLTPDVQTLIGDNELIYQIELLRTYQGTKQEKVGTFKAEYRKSDSHTPDENGNITIIATIDYEEPYMNTYGLPIGTYTLKNPTETYKENLKFDLPIIVKEPSEYTKDLFTICEDDENPQEHIASLGDNKIVLGDTENKAKVYTDYRYGLLEITPVTHFELPSTGGSSLIILEVVAVLITILGFGIQLEDVDKRKK